MDVKLYVGNLSYDTIENDLKELISQAGPVISVTLIKDRTTGMSKGFAFVEMDSHDNAQKAISMFNGYMLRERQITVNMARPREERGKGGFQQRGRNQKRGGGNRRY